MACLGRSGRGAADLGADAGEYDAERLFRRGEASSEPLSVEQAPGYPTRCQAGWWSAVKR